MSDAATIREVLNNNLRHTQPFTYKVPALNAALQSQARRENVCGPYEAGGPIMRRDKSVADVRALLCSLAGVAVLIDECL
jgi:hypothetical protein